MTTTMVFHFGDPAGIPLLFWLLAGSGILAGAVVFLLFRFPRLRRAEHRGGVAFPRLGLGMGILVAVLFLALAWQACWSGFFTLATDGSKVILYYRAPTRLVELPADQVSSFETQSVLGGGPWATLEVRIRDGRVYRSTRVGREGAEKTVQILSSRPSAPPPSSLPPG